LEGSYIGRVSNYTKLHLIIEEIEKGGMGHDSLKYIGENALLIQESGGVEVGKLIDEDKEWWEKNIESIKPWSSSQIIQNKLAWVRCRGSPFRLWSEHYFAKVVTPISILVSINVGTTTYERLEYARLRVKAPIGCRILMKTYMKINLGISYCFGGRGEQ